jgi:hypothetical protein
MENGMNRTSNLSRILFADAATCGAMGLLLISARHPIADLTAIPAALLFWAGASLIPVAAFIALVAGRLLDRLPLTVWLVIAGNAAWIVASFAIFALIAPNALGAAFILAQAAVVAVLTWLEGAALRGGVSRPGTV